MNNQAVFDKIINNHNEKIERVITWKKDNYKISLKRLNNKQLMELGKIDSQGRTLTVDAKNRVPKETKEFKIDAGKLLENQSLIMRKAISYSLDLPEKMVEKLPTELASSIFEEVMNISSMTDDDVKVLKNFPEKE